VRVLVAMSGGVDSSVAAALLRDDGVAVVGCTLRLWGGESDTGCCSAADVDDARRVCQALGIDHHVFNLDDEFADGVVAPYVAAHGRGATPNPCVACNRTIKFGVLAARAARLGFDALATGHHARVRSGPLGWELRRGADVAKDQSYVLGFLAADELERVRLPVGELTKGAVRDLAEGYGLRTAGKPDSQEVCFIPRGGRGSFLAARRPLTEATVVDRESGRELGTVDAVELVTLGQRRGVAAGRDGEPRYVVDVDVAARRVLVDRREAAQVARVPLEPGSLSWARATRPSRVLVQTSAHGAAVEATLDARGAWLALARLVRPVAPGQLAVLYDADDPDLVVGAATVGRATPHA